MQSRFRIRIKYLPLSCNRHFTEPEWIQVICKGEIGNLQLSCSTTAVLDPEFQLCNPNSRMNVTYDRSNYNWIFTPTTFPIKVLGVNQLDRPKATMRHVDFMLGRVRRGKRQMRHRSMLPVAVETWGRVIIPHAFELVELARWWSACIVLNLSLNVFQLLSRIAVR